MKCINISNSYFLYICICLIIKQYFIVDPSILHINSFISIENYSGFSTYADSGFTHSLSQSQLYQQSHIICFPNEEIGMSFC